MPAPGTGSGGVALPPGRTSSAWRLLPFHHDTSACPARFTATPRPPTVNSSPIATARVNRVPPTRPATPAWLLLGYPSPTPHATATGPSGLVAITGRYWFAGRAGSEIVWPPSQPDASQVTTRTSQPSPPGRSSLNAAI